MGAPGALITLQTAVESVQQGTPYADVGWKRHGREASRIKGVYTIRDSEGSTQLRRGEGVLV